MKKYINRNYFWADLFVEQLIKLGVRHVCISPGSRNTPLTLAFAENKKFKKYIHIDERSSGFFALGIAKAVKQPVVLVTTSGTAVAELYPAIIESFIERIPLIVCTADRPAYLRNTGANQTIDQENIYANHIKYYADFGLPNLNKNTLKSLCKKTYEATLIATKSNPGPVHLNFPFRKPLEPNSFTENIFLKLSDFIISSTLDQIVKSSNENKFKSLKKLLITSERPLIHCGWGNFDSVFYNNLIAFSSTNKIPILVDGTSDLRFYKGNNINIISNHSAFLAYQIEEPDLIIQFGNAPTSQAMLRYFEINNVKRYLINKFGDVKDPSRIKGELIKIDPNILLKKLIGLKNPLTQNNTWCKYIIENDKICEHAKTSLIEKSRFGLEPRIVNETLNIIPNNSNLFISNSLSIRDFDFFASKRKSNLKIHTNRGASGIDGIISTATGIAAESKTPTFLVIGDLSFFHNISALSTLTQLKIPLIIILVNNNGGGIFNMLPIYENNNFDKYFITSQNLEFAKIGRIFDLILKNQKAKNHFL